MRTVVIGTLHLGLTRRNDLRKILEELKPAQLLVELPEEPTARLRASQHSDEMAFAAMWAETKSIPVGFFDVNEGGILKDGVSENDSDFKRLVDEQVAELKAFPWQDLNRRDVWEKGRLGEVERELYSQYFDAEKWEVRERKMLENIKRLTGKEGTTVILTGAGHLVFFQKELPNAEFPYRN